MLKRTSSRVSSDALPRRENSRGPGKLLVHQLIIAGMFRRPRPVQPAVWVVLYWPRPSDDDFEDHNVEVFVDPTIGNSRLLEAQGKSMHKLKAANHELIYRGSAQGRKKGNLN